MNSLLAAVLFCSAASGAQPAAIRTNELAEADNQFGLSVFSYLSSARPEENVFISPLSIAIALQMTAHGSAGPTWNAMAGAMKVSALSRAEVAAANQELREQLDRADKNVRLDIANSLWLRNGIKLQKQFASDCGKYYTAPVTTLVFGRPAAITTINDWVSRNTGGRITKIVNELSPREILVLVNAIYFKGSWTKAFDAKLTAPREFHLASGAGQRRMMNREDKFRYKEDDRMQAVVLPYGDERLNMYIFLPRENDGLAKLISSLLSPSSSLFSGFAEKKGTVVLPRFKIEFEQDLNEVLIQLGMGQTPVRSYSLLLRDLIIAGRAKPSFIVSRRIPLSEAPDAYAKFDRREPGYTKVLIKPAMQAGTGAH